VSEYQFAVYNAFSDSTLGGSKAGIIADAENLDAEQMQRIAKQIEAPATCFITGINDHNVDVRFFSTRTEYSVCGHGTIGLMTWLVEAGKLAFESVSSARQSFNLRTPGSDARVDIQRRDDGRLEVMLLLAPASFEKCPVGAAELAPLFGIGEEGFVAELPVELTRSDFTHLMVPIRDLATMRQLKPDFEAITALCHRLQVDTLALFSTETVLSQSSIHCRDFCPAVGTPEAAATGTTNRAVACYLVRQGIIDSNTDGQQTVIVEQGYEMGRPSQIRIEMTIQGGQPVNIMAGGVATKSMQGILYSP
jgi:PhzF family phenazine biosynthesis protein